MRDCPRGTSMTSPCAQWATPRIGSCPRARVNRCWVRRRTTSRRPSTTSMTPHISVTRTRRQPVTFSPVGTGSAARRCGTSPASMSMEPRCSGPPKRAVSPRKRGSTGSSRSPGCRFWRPSMLLTTTSSARPTIDTWREFRNSGRRFATTVSCIPPPTRAPTAWDARSSSSPGTSSTGAVSTKGSRCAPCTPDRWSNSGKTTGSSNSRPSQTASSSTTKPTPKRSARKARTTR